MIKRKYRRDRKNYPFKSAAELYLTAVNELESKCAKKRNQALDQKGNYQSHSSRLMEQYLREMVAFIQDENSLSASEKKKRESSIKNLHLKLTGEKMSLSVFRPDAPTYTAVIETAQESRNKIIKARYKRWFLSHEDALNAEAAIFHSTQKLTIRKGEVEGGLKFSA